MTFLCLLFSVYNKIINNIDQGLNNLNRVRTNNIIASIKFLQCWTLKSRYGKTFWPGHILKIIHFQPMGF